MAVEYKIVMSDDSVRLPDRLRILEKRINAETKDGYRLISGIQEMHYYGERYLSIAIMEREVKE